MKQFLKSTSTNKALAPSVLILADGVYFLLNDPKSTSVVYMILGWLLAGASIYLLCKFGTSALVRTGVIKQQSPLKTYILSSGIYLLVILQALGQLTFSDIAAFIPFVIIGYLYFKRSKAEISALNT